MCSIHPIIHSSTNNKLKNKKTAASVAQDQRYWAACSFQGAAGRACTTLPPSSPHSFHSEVPTPHCWLYSHFDILFQKGCADLGAIPYLFDPPQHRTLAHSDPLLHSMFLPVLRPQPARRLTPVSCVPSARLHLQLKDTLVPSADRKWSSSWLYGIPCTHSLPRGHSWHTTAVKTRSKGITSEGTTTKGWLQLSRRQRSKHKIVRGAQDLNPEVEVAYRDWKSHLVFKGCFCVQQFGLRLVTSINIACIVRWRFADLHFFDWPSLDWHSRKAEISEEWKSGYFFITKVSTLQNIPFPAR